MGVYVGETTSSYEAISKTFHLYLSSIRTMTSCGGEGYLGNNSNMFDDRLPGD